MYVVNACVCVLSLLCQAVLSLFSMSVCTNVCVFVCVSFTLDEEAAEQAEVE